MKINEIDMLLIHYRPIMLQITRNVLPSNSTVCLFTSRLQAYAYWKLGKHNDQAVFDLYFRKNPFEGEFTVFAGLSTALTFLQSYSFTPKDIAYLKDKMPGIDTAFFDWLQTANCSEVKVRVDFLFGFCLSPQLLIRPIKVYALKEGSIAFPLVPLLRVEGPLAICQMLETTLLNTINFARYLHPHAPPPLLSQRMLISSNSLVCTNAARFRLAAGLNKTMLEFGLRRAQGPGPNPTLLPFLGSVCSLVLIQTEQ